MSDDGPVNPDEHSEKDLETMAAAVGVSKSGTKAEIAARINAERSKPTPPPEREYELWQLPRALDVPRPDLEGALADAGVDAGSTLTLDAARAHVDAFLERPVQTDQEA